MGAILFHKDFPIGYPCPPECNNSFDHWRALPPLRRIIGKSRTQVYRVEERSELKSLDVVTENIIKVQDISKQSCGKISKKLRDFVSFLTFCDYFRCRIWFFEWKSYRYCGKLCRKNRKWVKLNGGEKVIKVSVFVRGENRKENHREIPP